MIVFFLISFGILALIYGYVGVRIIMPLGAGTGASTVMWASLFIAMLLPHAAILLRLHSIRNGWADLLTWAAYLSLGFFTIVFPLLIARDAGLLAVAGAKKAAVLVRNASGNPGSNGLPSDPVRRRVSVHLLNMGILAASGVMCGYGFYEAQRRPRVKEVSIPVRRLPEALGRLRIVQITDLHISQTVKRPFIQGVVDTVIGLAPDMIVLTGDLPDGSVAELRNDTAPLEALSAPLGAYYVTGNHEYYSGVNDWLEEVRRMGFTTLNNEHRIIDLGGARLLLAGVTDFNGGMFDPAHVSSPAASIAGAPPADLRVLLAHQPRSVFEAERVGFDVQLSGHTHGGQYFPWNYFVRLQQPYTEGLVRHGRIWLYVSRGTGYWGPPLRIGEPSEITLITFTGA